MLLLHRSTRSTLSHSWQHSTKWYMHAELYSPAHTLTQPSQGCRSDAQHDVLVVHFAWPRINSPSHTLLFAHPSCKLSSNTSTVLQSNNTLTLGAHQLTQDTTPHPRHVSFPAAGIPHCRQQASVRLWHFTYSETSLRCTRMRNCHPSAVAVAVGSKAAQQC